MTAFVPDSIKVLGSDASGASVVLCEMYVNTIAELPAPDKFGGFRLAMGCTATVINDNSRHRINSEGQWVQIAEGTASYTREEIDSMIDRIEATEAEDRAALIGQVDGGAKNVADMSKTSFTLASKDGVQVSLSGDTLTSVGTGGTSPNNFFNIFYEPNTLLIPEGTWVASLHGTGTVNFRIEEFDDAHGTALKGEFGEPFTFTIPENATLSYVRITSKPGTNCAGKFKLLICTASDYTISPAFVPYAPTNRELYDMIKQYHP